MNALEIIAVAAGGALLLLIALLLIRAARFTPAAEANEQVQPVEYSAEEAGQHLAAMLRCKTVSNRDESLMDFAEYDRFVSLLPELYPSAMEKLHFERAGKTGLIYHWRGKTSA